MASAIQFAAVLMVVLLGAAAIRPGWRIPSLALGLLAIPGNVDNLLPQMLLDPNNLADATAPAVSVVDLLIAWALILTLVERRRPGHRMTRFIAATVALWVVTSTSALVALAGGVEAAAVLRGIIVFARIPALLYLAGTLITDVVDARRLAVAIAVGGVGLLGNGVYTTLTQGADRFTASTFGRNGFAIDLVLVALVASGLAFGTWSWIAARRRAAIIPMFAAVVAAASLFGSTATGTRMSLVVLAAACVGGLLAFPPPITRTALARMGTAGIAMVVAVAAGAVFTTAGLRTVSLVTDPGTTVQAVTQPDTVAEGSAIRTRDAFWRLAIDMAMRHPLTGVGPYQWNIERYVLDPEGPKAVADSHNAYLQIAAEYGFPALIVYALILGIAIVVILRNAWGGRVVRRHGWAAAGISIAALVYPIGELTNSHLFNVRSGAFGWLLIAVGLAYALTRVSTGTDTAPPR